MEQAILTQIQQLPEAAKAEALLYIQSLVDKYSQVDRMIPASEQAIDLTTPKKRRAGMLKGTFVLPLPEDFNEPLEDFKEYME